MKKILLALFFSLCFFAKSADAQTIRPSKYQKVIKPDYTLQNGFMHNAILEDGTYQMTVYYESSTEHRAKYTLNITIKNDNVVAIHFPEGGYVHPNSNRYIWRGGGIQWYMSPGSMGQMTEGKCGILLEYSDGYWQSFQMRFSL